jgi:glycosyltransferase involved in cell wall biosynthesis
MATAEGRIGVVVPTLNGAATLDWTLCSLRGQRDIGVEILVADSGSQDRTLEICKRWDVPTVYIAPGNMYRAVNEGLRRLDTEWITYLNSDDIVYPDAYARLVAHGEREKASVSYGDNDLVDYEGRYLFTFRAAPPERLQRLLRCGDLALTQAAAIFRRPAFEELGGFDERYRHVADVDFFYRLAASGKRFAKVPGAAVAAFRRHGSQLSVREGAASRGEHALFRNLNHVGPSRTALLDLACWRAQNLPEYFWRVLRRGDLRWVGRAVLRARGLLGS